MARRIKGKKMVYWGFYIDPDEKEKTIGHAESVNETDSEYIRKAIEMRNAQYKLDEQKEFVLTKDNAFGLNSARNMGNEECEVDTDKKFTKIPIGSIGGTMVTVNAEIKSAEKEESKLDKVLSAPPKHPKPNMVKSFMKGEK